MAACVFARPALTCTNQNCREGDFSSMTIIIWPFNCFLHTSWHDPVLESRWALHGIINEWN